MRAMGVIETKLLGKPDRFEGDIKAWKQRLAYFGAVETSVADDLALAGNMAATVACTDVHEDKQAK